MIDGHLSRGNKMNQASRISLALMSLDFLLYQCAIVAIFWANTPRWTYSTIMYRFEKHLLSQISKQLNQDVTGFYCDIFIF
jgi:hypothetical protein